MIFITELMIAMCLYFVAIFYFRVAKIWLCFPPKCNYDNVFVKVTCSGTMWENGRFCEVLLCSLFMTRFFSFIKYQLSNHCFVFSRSPKSLEKKEVSTWVLEYFDSVAHIDSWNTTVIEFYSFQHYYYYTSYLMISVNVGQLYLKVKYYPVLYVDSIQRIDLGHD